MIRYIDPDVAMDCPNCLAKKPFLMLEAVLSLSK